MGAAVDGYRLPMVTTRAFDVLPQNLQDRYGELVFTVHNGEYLEVPLDCDGELVPELRERGNQVPVTTPSST